MGWFKRLFGRPEWKNSDTRIRKQAVERLTDQKLLADIALSDSDLHVSWAAVDNLVDEALIARIAKRARDERIRRHAVTRISDESLLAEIATNGPADDWATKTAIEQMWDQALLVGVAKSGKKEAVWKIREPVLLTDLIENAPDEITAKTALRALVDCYANLQEDSEPWDIRVERAHSQLEDQGLLTKIAKNARKEYARAAAVAQMRDQTALMQIAQDNDTLSVRKAAIWNLLDHALLKDISQSDVDINIRTTAADALYCSTYFEDFSATQNSEVFNLQYTWKSGKKNFLVRSNSEKQEFYDFSMTKASLFGNWGGIRDYHDDQIAAGQIIGLRSPDARDSSVVANYPRSLLENLWSPLFRGFIIPNEMQNAFKTKEASGAICEEINRLMSKLQQA